MKLRFLYQEIQRRLRRHHNYMLVSQTLENRYITLSLGGLIFCPPPRFELVQQEELSGSEDMCAICWERMGSARRLPCRHVFHTYTHAHTHTHTHTHAHTHTNTHTIQRVFEAVAGAGHSLPDLSLFSEHRATVGRSERGVRREGRG